MSNQQDDFNFEEFTVRVIAYIDSIRSFQKAGGKTPTESRINAFYRAIGLPAILPKDTLDLPEGNPDVLNNGNIFDPNELEANQDILKSFDERRFFDQDITESEILNFVNFNSQDIMASISDNPKNKRLRGVLFPMYVDGRIHIFPQTTRFGQAFSLNKDLKKEKNIVYHRPLIETILYVKIKRSNQVNKTTSDAIIESTAGIVQTASLIDLGENSNIRIEQAINKIAYTLEEAVSKLNRARKDVYVSFVPTIGNIAEQNPISVNNTEYVGQLEQRELEIEDKEHLDNIILSLFEFGGQDGNLIGEGLASSFIELLIPKENERIGENTTFNIKRATKAQIEKVKNNAKGAYRSLELLLGTFAGISGIDIIAVIYALYMLDIKYLIALLNSNSKKNLINIKGNIPEIVEAENIKPAEAILKLQDNVKQIFININKIVIERRVDEKVRHSYPKKEK